MAMHDYVQMDRHLESFIITHPMDIYTQVNVFVDGMCEGQGRLSLERAEPATFKEAFAIVLRDDLRVIKAYTKSSTVTAVRSAGPESMEIDVFESSVDRRRDTSYQSNVCSGCQMICFRYESWDNARLNAALQHKLWCMRRTPIIREMLRLLVLDGRDE
uniref:Uncharacterized protein n=1 Tax=Peronospora matthiolae TaxID=2874970 RepID=A0AAV1V9Z1_9STRA